MSGMDLNYCIAGFAEKVGSGAIDIYNEFSLQHELGIYLRNQLDNCKIRFEQNVSDVGLEKSEYVKKEIDISITSTDSGEHLSAIELKYPRNGQVPESMFSFCKDIAFLEQLVTTGFQSAYFLAFAEDPLFYTGKNEGIYGFFRSGRPITGRIRKPTGAKDSEIIIKGPYHATWLPVSGSRRFCLIQIAGQNAARIRALAK